MDLAEFLLARIAEDERTARTAADSTPFGNWPNWRTDDVLFREVLRDDDTLVANSSEAEHIAWWDPARVLAECEAKRRIVAYCTPADDAAEVAGGYEPADRAAAATLAPLIDQVTNQALALVLQYLALPYADHPDYDPEWKP